METTQRAILFADVSDSTRIYELLGDTRALALINRVFGHLDKCTAKRSGTVVKTLGDGMVCMFAEPDEAFRAACDMHAAVSRLAAEAHGRMTIKIGFTYGPVVLSKGDVFGDTVNVCARMVAMANPEQALTTQSTVEALSPGLRTRCRGLFEIRVKGRRQPVKICNVAWRVDKDVTEANLARSDFARPAELVLKLAHRGRALVVDDQHPSLRLGRDETNEIVVTNQLVSRFHARILWRDGHFVLADSSSNGTFLLSGEKETEVLLRREEAVLTERGWIGLGKSAARHGDHTVRFRVERRNR